MASIKFRGALLAAALGLWSGAVALAQPTTAAVETLTRGSQLIFRGTVEQLGAVNLAILQGGEDTAVVRIDEVLHVPGLLEVFRGQEVTLKLSQPDSVKAGDSAVFFTRGWLYGEHLALVEVGHTDPGAAVPALVVAAHRKMADEELQQRLDGATLVVAGRVIETRASALVDGRRGTEHDPIWQEAVIAVDRVIKGDLRAARVVLLYPGSNDTSWHGALKPRTGQDGVWLLEPSPAAAGMYIAPKVWNLMGREALPAVERMVRR